ncbi:IclR family transcriptional regulator C-terminal domain-containing protein [Streptomyces sp. NPDC006510]|uniref:IclR family transcriptional regulator n=1 Tax=Streptomyces sp. NPDC006510 TaxID=3155600 RepID=UPI0033A19A24
MSAGTVKSLSRGLDVLLAVAALEEAATATEIAERLGRNRVQVARSLHSLEAAGLLARDSLTRAYGLSWRLRTHAVLAARSRLMVEGPRILREAVEATGVSAFLAEVRGDGAVAILEDVPSGLSWVGRSYPLYCDDAGQALLWDCTREELETVFAGTEFIAHGPQAPGGVAEFAARLRAARLRGYAVVDSESQPGVFAVAAPVKDFSGQIVCALHTQGPSDRLAPLAEQHGEIVRGLADRLSALLGWRP